MPYFYSAYHLVKAALLVDPIFADLSRLAAVRAVPAMEDRYADRHHGYMKNDQGQRVRVWGVNDLVAELYKPVYPLYSQLHEASVDVRYYKGLRVPLGKIADAAKSIGDSYRNGDLVAP